MELPLIFLLKKKIKHNFIWLNCFIVIDWEKKYKLDILSITWLWVLDTIYQKNTWLFVLVTIYPNRIPQLAHFINQYELVFTWTASQTPRTFSLLRIWWDKDLVYDPLMGMTIERVRVEEFGKLSVLDCGWINLVFL